MSFEDLRSPRRFEFTLASRLGMTRAELKSRLSNVELTEWRILMEVEAEEDERRK